MEKKERKNDEKISFQDIFSENFNSLIYDVDNIAVEEEGDIYADDPSPLHEEISESSKEAAPKHASILELEDKRESGEEEVPEEEGDIPENLPTSYSNAKFLNERYLLKLQEFLDNLIGALQANQSRQKELDEEIKNFNDQKPMIKKDVVRRTTPKPRSIIIFCAPYFKDVRLFSHPDNQDTKSRKSLEELSVYTLQPPKWLETDKLKLKKAVLSDAIHKRSKDFLEEINEIQYKINYAKGVSPEELKSMENKIADLSNKVEEIKKIPKEKLLMDPNEEFDWLKISAQTFKGVFNHKCVRCMWKNLLHPSINKNSWSKEEDERLVKLATSYNHKDWDRVAQELDRNRPAYLCFVRYQRKHKILEFANRKWSKEEDLRLCTLVKQCRINNYIPWSKVSYYMSNGRSKDMCYQRYIFSISEEIMKGHFRMEEDFIVILGVHVFGTEWNKIVRFLKNRTCTQVFARYNFTLSSNVSPWTLKEDQSLLQAIKTHGTKNWKNISDTLTSRTRYQCRKRFDIIYSVYRKDPKSFELDKCMKYSDNSSSLSKKRQDHLFEKLDELLKNCLDAEGIVLNENEPIPRDFLLRVMTILSDKLAYNTEQTYIGGSSSSKKVKSVALNSKELKIRRKYNDFFRKNSSNPVGREKVRFKDNEISTLGLIGTSLWNLLGCKDHLNLNDIYYEGSSEKYSQLFEVIRNCPKEFVKKNESSLQAQKPLLKTYSRKNSSIHKNSQSRISSKKTFEVSPPTNSSCIAMKNILSFLTDLHSRSNGPWKKESKKVIEKSRTEGIFAEKFSEMYWALGLNKLNSTTCGNADSILIDRFISVFFWPAVLSTIRSKRFDDIASLQEGPDSTLSSPSKSKRIKLMDNRK